MAGKSVLLVEGPDDEHVLKNICGVHRLPYIDEIKTHKSVEDLLSAFPIELKGSDVEAIGVVVDADADLPARWRSLRDRLAAAGYPSVPPTPLVAGTVLSSPPNSLLPRAGVWIMPDNLSTGILEDFLRLLVPAGSRLFDHAKSSVAAIPVPEREFGHLAEPKALIHTWLAWQEVPGRPLGTAVKAHYLDANVPQARLLVAWMRRLFFS